jgi:hypothetical protein
MLILDTLLGFEWDMYNRDKIFQKHKITASECEEACRDEHRVIGKDAAHSTTETRYHLIGATQTSKLLFISFTIRDKHMRIISARPITKAKEKKFYEN